MQSNYVFGELDKAWKSACKIIFGEQIGSLEGYENFLLGNIEPSIAKRSILSGKETYFSSDKHCEKAKFLSFDEIDFNKKYNVLDLNKIKDIDSIISELQDRFVYTGNVILGNSKYIEKSTNILDSYCIYSTNFCNDSKYLAYCSRSRNSDNIFGCDFNSECSYGIRSTFVYRSKRYFETYYSSTCSDVYFCQKLKNSQDCIFCFNNENLKYAIGNLEIEKGKYLGLKKKLLEEARELLQKGKMNSLIEITKKSASGNKGQKILFDSKEEKGDMKPIEGEFSITSELLIGKRLSGIENYETFLTKNAKKMKTVKNCLTNKDMAIFDWGGVFRYPVERIISINEVEKAGKFKLNEKEIESLNFKNVFDLIGKITYLCVEWKELPVNCIKCPITHHAINSYKSTDTTFTKNSAHAFWGRDSQNIYGVVILFYSSFCINCFYSKNLQRCFECDSCENCTDLYFSHNCENVHDSMFCFNAKNKRNAIGNVEYPKEQYAKIKKLLLEKISKELEEKKDLNLSIYNLGCFGSKNQ